MANDVKVVKYNFLFIRIFTICCTLKFTVYIFTFRFNSSSSNINS